MNASHSLERHTSDFYALNYTICSNVGASERHGGKTQMSYLTEIYGDLRIVRRVQKATWEK